MFAAEHKLVLASLRIASDLGHGGTCADYRLKKREGDCEASVRVSRPFPRPGETRFKPSEMEEVVHKDLQQADKFLGKLTSKYRVQELHDLAPDHPFLHPTSYSFSFEDASSKTHSFTYSIECSRHIDPRYQGLVQSFEAFFPGAEVMNRFAERERREQERDERPWWKFW